MIVSRDMSFMKKIVAYSIKKNGSVWNKMWFKKKGQQLGSKKNNWGKVKKIYYLEYKGEIKYK